MDIYKLSDSLATKMTPRHRKTIHDVPEDLLIEIFTRLPVKYIVRCMCVQKSWYSLIKTPRFITLHFNFQKITTQRYLLFVSTSGDKLTIRFDDVQCKEYYRTTHQPPALLTFHPRWLTHSNGLICVSSMFTGCVWSPDTGYHPNIHLWNPLVQKCKSIPLSPLYKYNYCNGSTCGTWKALALGFLPEVNDYVVVHIVKPSVMWRPGPHSVFIGVYSLNTNSWKEISRDNVSMDSIKYDNVVFINSAAFWLGLNSKTHMVMCFDTKTDVLREIRLPDQVELANSNWAEIKLAPYFHLFGQSVACFVRDIKLNSLDMWVLIDDPISESSWESKMSVRLTEDVRDILGVRNSGEPILRKLYDLITYDLDNHEPSKFVRSWNSWSFSSYNLRKLKEPPFFISPFKETLVLLDVDCTD